MLPAKCYCFAVAKTNAAISLEHVTNVQLLCLQAERHSQRRRSFLTAESLIERGWKLTLARGELNSVRASGLSNLTSPVGEWTFYGDLSTINMLL